MSGRLPARSASPTAATGGARPRTRSRRSPPRSRVPGLRRPRVRRPAVGRRRPRPLPRRDARAGPGPPRAGRRADRGRPRRARRADAGGGARGGRPSALPRRRAQGRPRATPSSRCWRCRPRARRCEQRGRLVVRCRRRSSGSARLAPGVAALAQRHTLDAAIVDAARPSSAAAASPLEWHAIDADVRRRGARGRPRGRGLDRPPPLDLRPPRAARRRRGLRRGAALDG